MPPALPGRAPPPRSGRRCSAVSRRPRPPRRRRLRPRRGRRPDAAARGRVRSRCRCTPGRARGEPRAVILALHGFGDAGDLTFDGAARAWAARGIAVYAPDQRGFGANASRKRWPGTDALVADAVAARRRGPRAGTPACRSSSSATRWAAASRSPRPPPACEADALVLAGPAIAGGDALNPLMRTGAWTIAAAAARAALDRREASSPSAPPTTPRRSPASSPTPATSATPPAASSTASSGSWTAPPPPRPSVTHPDPGADRRPRRGAPPRRDRAGSPTASPASSRIVVYPDGWHWLFRDRQAPRVWDDVADFALSGRAVPAKASKGLEADRDGSGSIRVADERP